MLITSRICNQKGQFYVLAHTTTNPPPIKGSTNPGSETLISLLTEFDLDPDAH